MVRHRWLNNSWSIRMSGQKAVMGARILHRIAQEGVVLAVMIRHRPKRTV